MRKSVFVYPFIMSVALVPCALHAQEFWHGIEWGMTKNQIRAVMPHVDHYTTHIGQKAFTWFGLPHYDLGGCDSNLSFVFDGNHLSSMIIDVQLTDGPNEDAEARKCENIIEVGLTSKYGPPAGRHVLPQKVISGEFSTWIAPNAQINCGTSTMEGYGSSPPTMISVTVVYRPRNAGAAGNL